MNETKPTCYCNQPRTPPHEPHPLIARYRTRDGNQPAYTWTDEAGENWNNGPWIDTTETPAVSPTSERQRDEESMDEAILRLEAARAALPTPTEAHWRIYYELKHAIEFLRAYEAQRREIKE